MSDRKPTQQDADLDYDEFDDLLNEFNTPPAPPPPTVATTSGSLTAPSVPPAVAPDVMDALSEDFASELARGMESLMRELGVPDDPTSGEEDQDESRKLLKAAWEAMLIEGLGDDTGSGDASDAGKNVVKDGQASGKDDDRDTETDFQRKIRQAMDKLKESESDLKANPTSTSDADADALAQMLAQFSAGEDGGEPDEEKLRGFFQGIMDELMRKEVLYEPLKELNGKFPDYLASLPPDAPSVDVERYRSQQRVVNEIISIFEDPDYHEAGNTRSEPGSKSTQFTERVIQLMTEMQGLGSPPPEIMGPLPPGVGLGADGLPNLEGCSVM